MSATVTLNVTQGWTESWQINQYELYFTHNPQGRHGLGATDDGETFSGDCYAGGGDSWQSLVVTDKPYDQVYWYVKVPGDTSALGIQIEIDKGDGAQRKSTMTYTFPLADGNKDTTGAYYEITAYIYRWEDLSVYWDSYKVWVNDAPRHD